MSVKPNTVTDKCSLIRQYSDVFSTGSLGKLHGIQSLKVDPTVTPVVMPAHRVPIALREPLKEKVNELVSLNVLCPVEEPTPWVNQMVTVRKPNGDIRAGLDPRSLNKAIQSERFQLPTLEDVLHNVSLGKVLSKVDVSNAYWHCELDYESSLLTTMQTPYGRYRWSRLPFGLSVSSEIF